MASRAEWVDPAHSIPLGKTPTRRGHCSPPICIWDPLLIEHLLCARHWGSKDDPRSTHRPDSLVGRIPTDV